MRRGWVVITALTFGACESMYMYQPSSNATSTVRGRAAAEYQLPSPTLTEGDLRIASFGISRVSRAQGGPMHAMHVRMVVSNNTGQPWTIDTREQLADVRGLGTVKLAFARSEGQDLPIVTVNAGQKRTIDLFFPLPPQMEKASQIPEFDILWRVHADNGRLVAQRTPFERLRIEPAYAGVGWGYPYYGAYGFGPFGWYDPFWGPGIIGTPGWYW
jgi:hypothetical protein